MTQEQISTELAAAYYADKLQDVYTERNKVVALLARIYPSGIGKTAIEGWAPEWHNVVYIDTPAGQMSWHYHDRDAYLFAGLPFYEKAWDGHTTPEKYQRLEDMLTALDAVQDAVRAGQGIYWSDGERARRVSPLTFHAATTGVSQLAHARPGNGDEDLDRDDAAGVWVGPGSLNDDRDVVDEILAMQEVEQAARQDRVELGSDLQRNVLNGHDDLGKLQAGTASSEDGKR